MDIEMLRERARSTRETRAFFDSRGYLETDTPLLSPGLIPETCLEVFMTERILPGGKKRRPYWLIPSPEIWMKRLIAEHRTNIYQICKCFRNGESSGHLHSPEFTMLEYYTMNAGYLDSLSLTEELLARLRRFPPFLRVTVEEAFAEWAGFDLYRAVKGGSLAEEARRLGLEPPPFLDTPALYDLIFIHAVEPKLPRKNPVVIMDYPAFVPCLAKKGADGKTTERWELYINGVELANCYSEETDPEEVRRYFVKEGEAKKRNALVDHAVDEDYWKIFSSFPACSGVALGLDRLVMAVTGRSAIDAVLPFPMSAI
ncbi:MAG: LysR family transcriptional regulator [Treponema sp.]|jgi:lysyl-tRNA synthetase class 2|nr:LysR family transcriptional regulator [Treponema sp.]